MKEMGAEAPDTLWLDPELHVHPGRLRAVLENNLDRLPDRYRTVLLGFGFCGNSIVGLEAKGRTLVLPRASDCISILLGAEEKRESMGSNVYYVAGSQNAYGLTILHQYAHEKSRRSEAEAEKTIRAMMANYQKIAVIDDGVYEWQPLMEPAARFAEEFGLPAERISGDLSWFRDLVRGNWNGGRFLVIPPGNTIKLEDAMRRR